MNKQAKWIRVGEDIGAISPEFQRRVFVDGDIKKATAKASAMGVYNLFCNGEKVGNALLAPGFTSYPKRVLYQEYDLTSLMRAGENTVSLVAGKGWAVGCFGNGGAKPKNFAENVSVIAEVGIETKYGELAVRWFCEGDRVRYEITVPSGITADLRFGDVNETVGGGHYVYFTEL